MNLTSKEITILIGLLSVAVTKEIDKDKPNYDLVAYYNNIQLKLGLQKKM